MTAITNFGRPECKMVADEIIAALKASGLEDKYGISFASAGGTMKGIVFDCKIAVSVNDPAAKEAKERADFNMYCRIYDLKPEHFGHEFVSGGERYRLNGINAGRGGTKNPLKILRLRDNSQRIAPAVWAAHIVKSYAEANPAPVA